MPAAKRISKEAIIDAAAAVLRTGGFEAINARSVAKSSIPLLLSRKSKKFWKAWKRFQVKSLLWTILPLHNFKKRQGNPRRFFFIPFFQQPQ